MGDPDALSGANAGSNPLGLEQHFNNRKWRIALYSPGMVGIGHMRRNLLIAQTLARAFPQAVILMIAEAREANVLALPPGGDCLTLPALRKEYDGECRPRYLNITIDELTVLRARAIQTALKAFRPDLFIVDHLPRGALRELDCCLEDLRAEGHTRCVLGLRDVLEHPDRVRRDWSDAANEEAIRDYYDAVWVYGDRGVYDLAVEYQLSAAIAAKLHYTGYLDCRMRPKFAPAESLELFASLPEAPQRLMLCTVGGGQDGANLAEAFAEATLPACATGVILMGPFMPLEVQRRLQRRAAGNPQLRVLEFVTDPDWLLSCADRVVAMGGYNTTCEILSFEKHALIIPRSKPRHEQQIRAERLARLGLIEALPAELVSPHALTEWLSRDLGPAPRVHERIDLNGTARLPYLMYGVLAGSSAPKWSLPLEVQHVEF